jgi:hypothetical protein
MMKIGPAVAAATVFAIASPVCAQDAVQWRVEDGGNGHWYGAIRTNAPLSWHAARSDAESHGGALADFAITGEFAAVVPGFARQADLWIPGNWWRGPWIGAFQDTKAKGYTEPSGGWYWIDGSDVSSDFLIEFGQGNPNNYPCCEDFLQLGEVALSATVNDVAADTLAISYLIEWSADCNSDGIVDYGQIRDGTFPDVNTNGVPDCCEPGESCTPCPGDVTNGGTVDAADLSILLAAWGTNGQGEFDTDLNGDGLVDGGDLALVLGGWGACP